MQLKVVSFIALQFGSVNAAEAYVVGFVVVVEVGTDVVGVVIAGVDVGRVVVVRVDVVGVDEIGAGVVEVDVAGVSRLLEEVF
jgi:hypothetical protein